ncbi:MAG TPA: TonB-dependent receptor [Pyrinomonadaceae bacterium]|nr:TonB-dependent receptor [Pyrinomonadaceae bacterium]
MSSFSLSLDGLSGAGRLPLVRRALAVACCVLLATALTLAQTAQGTIQGVVRDQNGAVVVGATVEATNNATGDKRTATTNDEGFYTFPTLNVGTYTLSITGPGFANATVRDVNVTVSFVQTQDVTLAPAGAQEVVTVASAGAETALNTTDQQLSTLITNEKILDLPLLSRDPNALLLLAPGAVASSSRLGGITVNGQRERNNNFLVDGIDNNDADVPGIPGGISTPNIDATQEFRVITNNFTAEYGRNTGAIVNVATKSGTNDLHGAAYIYYRSDAFAARDFFDITGKADPLQRRQYGGSIGGPIRKDRTFFFFNYERDDFDQGISVSRIVPTAAARAGVFDFSGAPSADDRALGVINIGNATNNRFGLPVNTNFQQLLNQIYPLPNTPGEAQPLPGIFERFRFSTQTNDLVNQISTRLDHRISEKHNLSGSFAFLDGTYEFCCESFPGLNDAILSPQRTYRLSTNLVSTFSSNFINEFRFGGNRSELIFGGPGDAGVSPVIGNAVNAALTRSGANRESESFGGVNGSLTNLGTSAGFTGVFANFDTQFRYTGTTHFGDSVTWVKGDHTLKFGGEARFVYSNGASNFFRGETLNLNFASNAGISVLRSNGGANLGFATGTRTNVQNLASMLYGLVYSQTQSQFFNKNGERVDEDYRGFRTREYDWFVQDSWKVRPNLTLSLGLRWEFKGVPYEVNGQLSNLVIGDPSFPTPEGGFIFELVGKNSGGRFDLWEPDHNNFAPRVGFAYSPDFREGFISKLTGGPGRTSIRGGYGVFYDRVFGNLFSNSTANPPFQFDFNSTPRFDCATCVTAADFVNASRLSNFANRPATGDPSPVIFDGAFIFPNLFPLPGNNQFQDKFATPYTQSWNFGMQRQFAGNVLAEADYVGSKGTNLLRAIDGNMTSVERANQIFGTDAPIDPFDTIGNYLNGSTNYAFFQSNLNLAIGHSTYHAGQFRLTKGFQNSRFGRGSIQGAYTLSHSIDNAPDPLDAQTGERVFPRDSSGFAGGLGAERGNSGFDVRHRFVGNMVWEIPFRSDNRLLSAAFSNWTMSGIWQWQSGSPYTVFGFTDSAGTALGQRADYLGGNLDARSSGLRTQTGPDASLFATPCPVGDPDCEALSDQGRQGNTGRNAFYGPEFNNVDFSLIKRFPFGEDGRYKFTVRMDAFNLFNKVNFGKPVNTIASANFGQSTDAFRARVIQFVGRFDF